MLRSLKYFLLVAVASVIGCNRGNEAEKTAPAVTNAPTSSTIIHAHFVGTTHLATDTNALPWMVLGEKSEFQTLWLQTLTNLAETPHRLFQPGKSTDNFQGVIQEIIADIPRAESFVEVTGDTNKIAEVALAIRLPAARAEFWQTNLKAIVERWAGGRGEPLAAGAAGWQVKSHDGPGYFRFVRKGDWTFLSWGPSDQMAAQQGYLKTMKDKAIPAVAKQDAWFELSVDGPLLAGASGAANTGLAGIGVSGGSLPTVDLQIKARGKNLDIRGDLVFREALSLKLESWQVPTNLIHEPLIGFSAIRGIAPRWDQMEKALGLPPASPRPNQILWWNGNLYPVNLLVAVPLPRADEYLQTSAQPLAERFNAELEAAEAGHIVLATNHAGGSAIRWIGIPPWVTPIVTGVTNSGTNTDVLLAGIYPNWDGGPPSPVLLNYLAGKTNLVYYDWEITSERLQSWRAIINIFRHFFNKPRVAPDAPSVVWMNSISNLLGNTVTELVQTGPNRLSLTRQGPIGLTGIEMITLAHWLESVNFPTGYGGLGTNSLSNP